MLASSYHDLGYIMNLDYEDGLQVIAKARDRKTETKQWQLYCSVYPHMNKESFVSFEDFFKKPAKQPETITRRTKYQILEEANKLKELFGKGK